MAANSDLSFCVFIESVPEKSQKSIEQLRNNPPRFKRTSAVTPRKRHVCEPTTIVTERGPAANRKQTKRFIHELNTHHLLFRDLQD